MDASFNQSILAQIMRTSPNSVSRAITTLGIEPIESDTSHNKRYTVENSRKITDHLFASTKRPILQKTQVFYNFKGGTGKTSLCYQVSTHLALLGFKVLSLDLDPQGHLSHALGLQEDWNGPTIYDILIHDLPLEDALLSVTDGFDLLPANISMTRIEVPLSSKTKREEKLRALLDPIKDQYDFIVIDTNPTISTLNMNALVASDRVNIVCETQPFSLNGLRVLVDEMISFYDDMGAEPNYCIIPNKYEIKTASAQEVLGALRNQYGQIVLSAVVRKSEDINVANKKHLPIAAFCKSKSPAFEDIMDLVHTLVDQSQSTSQTTHKAA
jgi:chromosome partitioning protein